MRCLYFLRICTALPRMNNYFWKKAMQESKIHKKKEKIKFFLDSLEKNLNFCDFFIDFSRDLSYNRGCMDWVSAEFFP